MKVNVEKWYHFIDFVCFWDAISLTVLCKKTFCVGAKYSITIKLQAMKSSF
jgi:hypothetical protein